MQLKAREFLSALCVGAVFVIPAPSTLSMLGGSWLLTSGFFCILLWTESKASNAARGWLLAALASTLMAFLQVQDNTAWTLGWVSASPDFQAYANLRQRNHLASLLAIGLCAVLYFSMQGSDHPHPKFASQMLVGLAVSLMTLAQALTASRTGALQWFAVLGLAAWLMLRSGKKQSLWVIAWAGVGFMVCSAGLAWYADTSSVTGIVGRFSDDNAMSRLPLWRNVLELIAQKPLLGWGWRGLAYAHYSTDFSGNRFMEMLDNAHNLPLHLAVELGLPVALIFCGGVVWLIWKNKPWTETQPDRQLAWGILMVIGIHSLVEYPLWYGPFFMTALICVGILCVDLWRNWLLALTKSTQSAINLGIKGLGLLLMAYTIFAAFDYHRVSQIYLPPDQRSTWYADDALGAAKRSVLFQSHAKFAELVITPLSRETAPRILALSSELVVWSPEPRVIEKLIESAVMMQLDELAAFHLRRYRVAYPSAYKNWAQAQGISP